MCVDATKKEISAPYRESNPGHSTLSLIIVLTKTAQFPLLAGVYSVVQGFGSCSAFASGLSTDRLWAYNSQVF
jgi:hypothetical protein